MQVMYGQINRFPLYFHEETYFTVMIFFFLNSKINLCPLSEVILLKRAVLLRYANSNGSGEPAHMRILARTYVILSC